MTDIALRPARPADLEPVRTLIAELGYADTAGAAFAGAFGEVLRDEAQRLWLAEQEGVVVGLMSLSTRPQIRLSGPILTIDELVVTAGARGMGVGKKLLERAKEEARRTGARRLELHTARGRPSYARGFYAKNGFVEVDSAVMRFPVDRL